MQNVKMFESFVKGSDLIPTKIGLSTQNPDVVIPSKEETPVASDEKAMRARLEADVKRLYPNLSIRHTPDGQSGVALDNNVIYASDHFEAFNAFLFGLIMAKMQDSRGGNDRMPVRY